MFDPVFNIDFDELKQATDTIHPPHWMRVEIDNLGWADFLLLHFADFRKFSQHIKSGCKGCNYEFAHIRGMIRDELGEEFHREYKTLYFPHGNVYRGRSVVKSYDYTPGTPKELFNSLFKTENVANKKENI